jgi:hypothetical protein
MNVVIASSTISLPAFAGEEASLRRVRFDEPALGGVTGSSEEEGILARDDGDDIGGALLLLDERWCDTLPGRGEGNMPELDEAFDDG